MRIGLSLSPRSLPERRLRALSCRTGAMGGVSLHGKGARGGGAGG